MECPKCKTEITEDMLVCPNCKKVLKLVCPKCETINKTNTCKKCGFVIISKCHNCGKINQTITNKCSKCGFSTYTSVAINSSNLDEFACLTIEFPNLGSIKTALGSIKLTEKFKANLDKLITDYTGSIGMTREIIENVYIIRFNRDESFKKSSLNAIKAAIEIQNIITDLNQKLNKLKNTLLECRIAVLKRDIYSKPNEYKSGFDIKLIYTNKKDLKLINSLQVITDYFVYEQVCDEFSLSSLTSNFIKNQMVMFFELNLKKYIKIRKPKEEESEQIPPIPTDLFNENNTDENEEENKLYNVDSINFDELKCTFTSLSTIKLADEIVSLFNQNNKKIVLVKGKEKFLPSSNELPDILEKQQIFKNIFRITCYDEMKYKPYGFFQELISNIYNYTLSPKYFGNNNLEIFKEIDESGLVKDLMNFTPREFPHPEDVRYSLFDIFTNIFSAMSNSLIYIENFEKIDDTSYEILQLIFEKFKEFNVSYLIFADETFALHKNSHFLLAEDDYSEIKLKPSPIKEVIEKNIKKYSKILDSYYLKTIIQNTKGSLLYFNNAIDYLLERELLTIENDVLKAEKFENILIPQSLDELLSKRLQRLSKDKDTYKMFSMLLMIAPSIDLFTIKSLQIPSEIEIIQKLAEKNYIYIYNNTVYIQNFNLFREIFIKHTPIELKQELAKEILEKVFSGPIDHPAEITLYKILEQEKKEFIVLESLSNLNASFGDFSAYLNCCVKLLKLLDNHVNEYSQKTIEKYKMEVYENISNLLYKYTPNEIYNISKVILENLEKTINDKKVINLCNKMLQGCLISGNYSYALELIHKILSKFPNASINPKDENFSIAFFLISLVKIEVLFSVGNLKECEDSGDEILQALTPENIAALRPQHLSQKQFEEVIFESMSFVAVSKILSLKNDSNFKTFLDKIETNTGKRPSVFNLFIMLKPTLKGERIELPIDLKIDDDKFSNIIFNLIKAFNNTDDYKKFANDIYQAKISAKMQKLLQVELICDLLIGYSYFMLDKDEKASSIYYNVLEVSTENGLKLVTYICWYLISLLKLKQNDIEMSFGIANNAIIQLEKDNSSGDFLFFLFRMLLSEILTAKGDTKSAELCLRNAMFIKDKWD